MSGKIKWRLYRESDRDAVVLLHAGLEERIGMPLDLPDLMERPVIVAVVGETDGKVTHGVFLEAEVEACAIGPRVLTAADMQGALELLMPAALQYRIRMVRAFVPKQLAEGMKGRPGPVARMLGKIGFTRENDSMVQFYRWLDPEKETTRVRSVA